MRRGLVFATSICRASHNCEAYATWACFCHKYMSSFT